MQAVGRAASAPLLGASLGKLLASSWRESKLNHGVSRAPLRGWLAGVRLREQFVTSKPNRPQVRGEGEGQEVFVGLQASPTRANF